jgi:hypothetical protein
LPRCLRRSSCWELGSSLAPASSELLAAQPHFWRALLAWWVQSVRHSHLSRAVVMCQLTELECVASMLPASTLSCFHAAACMVGSTDSALPRDSHQSRVCTMWKRGRMLWHLHHFAWAWTIALSLQLLAETCHLPARARSLPQLQPSSRVWLCAVVHCGPSLACMWLREWPRHVCHEFNTHPPTKRNAYCDVLPCSTPPALGRAARTYDHACPCALPLL